MSDVTYRTVDVQEMAAEEIRDAKDNGVDPRVIAAGHLAIGRAMLDQLDQLNLEETHHEMRDLR